jgi:hypothetical protein
MRHEGFHTVARGRKVAADGNIMDPYLVDALGNPTAFCLTAGQAHDLDGADKLLPGMAANLLIAGKAFDADERAIDLLAAQNKTVVISPRANRKISQD